jgi:hypothetical protein
MMLFEKHVDEPRTNSNLVGICDFRTPSPNSGLVARLHSPTAGVPFFREQDSDSPLRSSASI